MTSKTALTIGNFDGVHRGHQALIDYAARLAGKISLVHVLTFEPHPREFFGKAPVPERLCSPQEKLRRMHSLGIRHIHVQSFTRRFADQTAEKFLEWVQKKFRPAHIVIGSNFHFGKNRSGSPHLLLEWGNAHGVHVEVMEALREKDELISSSVIRHKIQNGKIAEANALCGFEYRATSRVQKGDGRGAQLGFPTLNMRTPKLPGIAKLCLPTHGVYVTRTLIGKTWHPSITNFGLRPTFHPDSPDEIFESHLLDSPKRRLSSGQLTVEFLDRIRPEHRFAGKDELIQQIRQDIAQAKRFHNAF